jgi:hypothetical protein
MSVAIRFIVWLGLSDPRIFANNGPFRANLFQSKSVTRKTRSVV